MDPQSLGYNSSCRKALEEKDRHQAIGIRVIMAEEISVKTFAVVFGMCADSK